jgi:thiaminase
MTGTAASRLTEQILEEAKGVEAELIEHPFFRALLEDDIPEVAYLRWVREDTLFARAIRRVLGTLIAKAPDESSIDVLSAAYAPLNAEIDLFSSEARKGNVDFSKGPMPATAKFIGLLQSSADVGFAEGIGAYWAGEKFYLDLWGTLLPRGGKGRYAHWFATWTAAPFPEWVASVGDVVDRHGEPQGTRGAALEVFERERDFWDYCWTGK